MKLSKSLQILSYVYMLVALFILAVAATFVDTDGVLATNAIQTDLMIFLLGAFLDIMARCVRSHEKWMYLYS